MGSVLLAYADVLRPGAEWLLSRSKGVLTPLCKHVVLSSPD